VKEKILRRLYSGFLSLHILHHASEEAIYGIWMIHELRRHGYDVGASVVYPMLHRLERWGLLSRHDKTEEGKVRKYYETTDLGEEILAKGREKAKELAGEILTEDDGTI